MIETFEGPPSFEDYATNDDTIADAFNGTLGGSPSF